ncbi:YhcB family protein [Halomonas halocynthiae]|uniref:YhcB family protein n=1 Tax=Halomonas halocynthiae TaxID=176290 RepID=UPI0003F66BD5|nr:DUF1043 family protein [Halomonas halocynthiae]
MEESNINIVLIIACLVAGSGIGALGYHLLSSGTRQSQRLRQRLADKERELSEMHSGLSGHVERLTNMAQTISRESQALVQEANEAGVRLGIPQQPTDLAATHEASHENNKLHTPRDYADGNSGTLSEDFGLKKAPTEPPQQQTASH